MFHILIKRKTRAVIREKTKAGYLGFPDLNMIIIAVIHSVNKITDCKSKRSVIGTTLLFIALSS